MYGAEVGVLKQAYEISLACLLLTHSRLFRTLKIVKRQRQKKNKENLPEEQR
jgi:hypothetical protein